MPKSNRDLSKVETRQTNTLLAQMIELQQQTNALLSQLLTTLRRAQGPVAELDFGELSRAVEVEEAKAPALVEGKATGKK